MSYCSPEVIPESAQPTAIPQLKGAGHAAGSPCDGERAILEAANNAWIEKLAESVLDSLSGTELLDHAIES